MFWEYIAGFFDGEGHVAISLSYGGRTHLYPNVTTQLTITNSEKKPLLTIKDFLSKNNITSYFWYGKKEKIYRLFIGNLKGVTLFCNNVSPYSLVKERQLEIVLEAIKLKEFLKENNQLIKDNLDLFDELRQELHSLSHKGPRILKKWPKDTLIYKP